MGYMSYRGVTISPATLAVVFILMALAGECSAALKVGFYTGKCGSNNVEQIAFNVIKAKFDKDPTIVAALLRMHFHDCFVRGCDASLLLDGSTSEKTAGANGSVRGFELIDAVKSALEKLCPQVVSCADIIAISTRAAVILAGGRGYNVETGRRDGLVSQSTDSDANLPGPTIAVAAAVQAFAAKGISKEDFVLLLSAHTVGVAHCGFFQDRLDDFNGVSGTSDPTMNSAIIPSLKKSCPSNGDGNNAVFLDQSTPKSGNRVDNGFCKAIVAGKGILQIDQRIALDASTKGIVGKYAANNSLFQVRFGQALVRMGRIGVLTGSKGEIRKSCHFVNK